MTSVSLHPVNSDDMKHLWAAQLPVLPCRLPTPGHILTEVVLPRDSLGLLPTLTISTSEKSENSTVIRERRIGLVWSLSTVWP